MLPVRGSVLLAMLPVMWCFVGAMVFAQETRTLTIEADEWCPINCAMGAQEGVGIELARKVFEPMGYKVNYVVVPWTQALADMKSGKADAIIGASTQDDPGLIFPRTPLLNISDDFYVLNGSPWRYQGPHTLKDKRIGVIEGYGYGAVVKDFVAANRSRSGIILSARGKDALAQNMASLKANKIDALVESRPVMDYTLKTKGEGQIIWAGGIEQGPVYLAFSPVLPASRPLAAAYDAGVEKLKASGENARIYRAYGLNP